MPGDLEIPKIDAFCAVETALSRLEGAFLPSFRELSNGLRISFILGGIVLKLKRT